MLSYRHAFHAGNHADILKHLVLCLCLEHLNAKEKPYLVLDTHAGAGIYPLDSAHAGKTGEYRDGIGRLWGSPEVPDPMKPYMDAVRDCNAGSRLKRYPGSPWLAARLCRDQDTLRFCELHPTDFDHLRRCMDVQDRRIGLERTDGFDAVKANLPPPSRRGLILIDPPYEVKSDYSRLLAALNDGLKRFATGTYLVWLPFIPTIEAQGLPVKLKKLPVDWLYASLSVRRPATLGHGMHGSAMFVVNPPWTLRASLAASLPWLAGRLAQDERAASQIQTSDPAEVQASSS